MPIANKDDQGCRRAKMQCREFVERLDDYLNGELAAPILGEYDEHAVGCADCSAYLQSYQITTTAIRKLIQYGEPSAGQIASLNRRILDRLSALHI